ncbi:HNH endonuclease [Shinella sp.]|uniref:HNH endonuclease n=1 Tax=Shinella sp. TaxID=1870904 RepID=UPI00258F3732|nr:HNH endonuclease [Shinella sp.]MCW5706744.1 HNH endonuclease [Shinella sp.]
MAKFMRIRHRLREAQGNLCCYCSQRMGPPHKGNKPHPHSETIEHLRRRADGGTNHPDNLALACSECNTGRGAMDWLTYKTVRAGEIYREVMA